MSVTRYSALSFEVCMLVGLVVSFFRDSKDMIRVDQWIKVMKSKWILNVEQATTKTRGYSRCNRDFLYLYTMTLLWSEGWKGTLDNMGLNETKEVVTRNLEYV
jgi:hypothetical protein